MSTKEENGVVKENMGVIGEKKTVSKENTSIISSASCGALLGYDEV